MIEHLVVVAGPAAAGKSKLIEKIRASQFPEINARLGVSDFSKWPFYAANTIINLTQPFRKKILLEYNALPRRRQSAYDQDKSLHILRETSEVSFITLWTPPTRIFPQRFKRDLEKTLRSSEPILSALQIILLYFMLRFLPNRMRKRTAGFLLYTKRGNRFLSHRARKFLNKCHLFYLQPYEIVTLYRRWMQFCDRHISKTRNNIIVEYDKKLKFYTREEWEKIVHYYT